MFSFIKDLRLFYFEKTTEVLYHNLLLFLKNLSEINDVAKLCGYVLLLEFENVVCVVIYCLKFIMVSDMFEFW